ncbi:MAG TPA: hypothetical protein DEV81_26610 [Cyanobacteria bacterium UBA11049]|nr:hypothetical protein [Cyanobacteria bacterium UBA11049]
MTGDRNDLNETKINLTQTKVDATRNLTELKGADIPLLQTKFSLKFKHLQLQLNETKAKIMLLEAAKFQLLRGEQSGWHRL